MESSALVEQFDVARSSCELHEFLILEKNQGFAEISPDLSSENMEVVCCRRADAHLHVTIEDLAADIGGFLFLGEVRIIVHQLQVSFDPCGTVFWTLAIHPVGKQHNQPALNTPFGLSSAYVIVYRDLPAICEITELTLP